jgi:hypothetical protein
MDGRDHVAARGPLERTPEPVAVNDEGSTDDFRGYPDGREEDTAEHPRKLTDMGANTMVRCVGAA